MSLVAPSMRGGYFRYLSAEWRDVFIGRLVLRLQSVVLVEAAVALCYVGVVTAFAFRFGDFRLWTTFVALASFFFILSVLGLGLSASKARDHRRLRVLSLIVGVSVAGAAWRIFTTVKLIHYLCNGHGAPLDVDSSLDYECRKDFIAWTLVLCILFIVVGIPIISMSRVLRVRIERAIAFMDLDHDAGRPERDRRARRERVEELIVYVNESDVEDSEECVVCFDKPKNAVLLECGHLQICIDCARLMDACPVCRKNITSIIHRRVRVRSHNGDEPNDSDDVNVANDSGDGRAVEAGQGGEGGGGREEEGSGVPATATTASPAAGSTPALESPPPPPPPPTALPRSGVSSAQLSGPLGDGAWIGSADGGGGSGGEGAGAPAGGPLGPTTASDSAKGRGRGGDGEGRRARERERSRQRKERKAAKKSSKRTARHGEGDLSKRLAVSSSSRSASASSSPSSAAVTSSSSSSSSSSTISATSYSRSSGSSSLASPPGPHGLSHTSPRPLRSHAAGTSAPSAISLGLSPREAGLLPSPESARKGKKAVRKSTRKEGTTKSSSRRKHGGRPRTEGGGGGGGGGGEGGEPSRSNTRGEAGGGRSGRPLNGSESGSSPSSGRVGSSRGSRTASSSSSRLRSRASVTSSSSSSASSSSSLSFARRRGGGGLAKGGAGGGAESAAVGAGIGSSGKKANSNKKKKLCPKCNDGSPICMLVPCGHQFCESCARTQLTNCFTCTAPISKRVVLY